jgi:RNase P/RNase MRP subunit p29
MRPNYKLSAYNLARSQSKIFFLFATLFFNSNAAAQNLSITGRVVDTKGLTLKLANVNLLLSKDSSLVTAATTNSKGQFSISANANSYLLQISMVGYVTLKTRLFQVSSSQAATDLGTLTLTEESISLKGVAINSSRPTIVQLPDRLVVNIEGTVVAAGRNAFQILSKAPGVFISPEGAISLNGRSGVSVMIDGKLTYLSGTELRSMLEGMPAENVKNIEVISNPSAKYDAEGTAGMLNINLKRNLRTGINGSVYSSVADNFNQVSYTYGGNVNYKTNRWNSFLNLDASHQRGGRNATFTRVFKAEDKTTFFDQVAVGNFLSNRPPAIRTGTDFSLNSKTTIGGMIYYTTRTSNEEFLTDTYLGNQPNNPSQFIDANNYSKRSNYNLTGNLHLMSKIDTNGRSFSADFYYVKIGNKGQSNFYNYLTEIASGQQTQDFLYTNIPGGYNIYAVQSDYSLPLKDNQLLDIGVKGSKVISDNDSKFYFNNAGLVIDPDRTNHFNYRERILALYFNYRKQFSKKLTLQAGLRTEQTASTGNSYTTGTITKRNYLDYFPSVFLQTVINKDYNIDYSYTRRITRPNYGSLNPFRFYRDPYTWEEGNPYLRPQYSHSFNITQTLKQSYSLVASYQINKDVMAELPYLDAANATTIYTTGNVNHGHSMSLSASIPVQIFKWWNMNNSLVATYNKLQIIVNNAEINNNKVNYYVESDQVIQLPADIKMELDVWYQSPTAQGLYIIGTMWRTDIAFRKNFLRQKLQLSLTANDLFKTQRYVFKTNINGNINDFNQYFRFQNAGLTLRYNFSSGQKFDVKRKNGSPEETNRT